MRRGRFIMSINRVIISGNLTRDPELRTTASGFPCSVSAWRSTTVARTSRRANGRIIRTSSTARCSVRAPRAFPAYLIKGTKVSIDGKLRWSQWERRGPEAQQDRGDRRRARVHVEPQQRFVVVRASYGGIAGGYSPAPAAAPVVAAPVVDASSSVYDEDIPF